MQTVYLGNISEFYISCVCLSVCQVDVWSLGITLFNMIAGRPPFLAANQLDLAAKIQNMELSYPEELIPIVDPHLRHLMSRMLDKNWKTRFDLVRISLRNTSL